MNEFNASYIGAVCAEFRRICTKATQQDVADEVGVARESVSKFERGVVCNGLVFMWYIKQGLFEWMPIEKFDGWRGFFQFERSN